MSTSSLEQCLPGTQMTRRRYRELEYGPYGKLTQEEVSQGWHFCPEWDGMLIHVSFPEHESCTCGKS